MKLLNLAVYVFLTLLVPITDCLFCIFFGIIHYFFAEIVP